MNKTTFTVAFLAIAAASQATLIFDQGPGTATSLGGSWVNWTSSQNFADRVTLSTTATVVRYRYYTNFDPTSFGTMTLKLWSDDGANNPSAPINTQSVSVAGFGFDSLLSGTPINYVDLNLTTPWTLTGGVKYWVGASGDGFEAAQITLRTPDDGFTAQFSAGTFSHHATIGDQAFQLHGDVVPEPATMTLLGLGALALYRKRKA